MKNKKILAIALAAALAVTAIIPGVAASAADSEETGVTGTGYVEATSKKAGKLTTSGSYIVTSGSFSAGSIEDTVTLTVTTNSGAEVHSFADDEKTVFFEVEGDGATVEFEDDKNTVDLTNTGEEVKIKVSIEANEDTEDKAESVVNVYDSDAKDHLVAQVIYTQAKAKSSGGSSSGTGAGGSSGSGTSKVEKLADGSTKTTTVTNTATGKVTTVTTTKTDGSKTIVKKVENKDGSGSVTETTITKAGTETTVMIVTDKTGAVVEVSTSVSNAKGVSAKMTYSVSGSKITLAKVETKGKTAVSIPATVKCDGKTFKVTKIGAAALKGNKEIKKVTVGKNVTAIGKNAFKGDSNLKTVVLKGKVTSVGKNAFNSVNKKATFKIAKANFKTVKKAIKKSGVAKTVKYKKA